MNLKKSHIYRIAIFSALILLSIDCFGQGRINRPPKSNPQKTQTQRPQQQRPQSIQQDDPVQRYYDSIVKLPREEEFINNILVR